MLVIPALDLRGGRCVRLYQGDPERETVYGEDPAGTARRWAEQGAKLLHLVDLDGAFNGDAANAVAVAAISEAVDIPFQLGGGIRTRDSVEKALAAGAGRVILGTVAVQQPGEAKKLAAEFGRRVLVGIDARDGRVAVKGWTETSALTARDLASRVEQWGVREIVYTDIRRDGTLRGPNLQGLEELLEATGLAVIMSGGISSLEDLLALKPYAGRVPGVIVGQALYANRISLPGAIAALQ